MDLIIPHFYGFFFFQDKCSKNRASISSLHHMCNYPTGIFLFHENSPRASDRFQLSHLLLSSFWGGLLWERGEGIVLVETGSKIIPGAAHPLPWKPKNGMCTEIPSPAGNLGGFIPDRGLGGFVPAVLFQDLSFGWWCLTGAWSTFSMFGSWASHPWGFSSVGF